MLKRTRWILMCNNRVKKKKKKNQNEETIIQAKSRLKIKKKYKRTGKSRPITCVWV